MGRAFDGWLDVFVVILLFVASAMFTFSAVDNIAGVKADIGHDKVTVAADHLIYEDVVYTVSDLLFSIVRTEFQSPADIINVSLGANSVSIDATSTTFQADKYTGARQVLKLKPSGETNTDFYNRPISTTLVLDTSQGLYTFNVMIGG